MYFTYFGRRDFLSNNSIVVDISEKFCDTLGGGVACISLLGAITGLDLNEVNLVSICGKIG